MGDGMNSVHPIPHFHAPFTAALPLAAAPRALRAPATFAPFRPRRPAPSGFLQPFTAPSVKRLRLCRGEGARGRGGGETPEVTSPTAGRSFRARRRSVRAPAVRAPHRRLPCPRASNLVARLPGLPVRPAPRRPGGPHHRRRTLRAAAR